MRTDWYSKYEKKCDMGCRFYDKCSAPLCPLNGESMNCGVWYPDDEICRKRESGCQQIIENQKAIDRRAKDNTTYFTGDMLNRKFVIRKGITGIDPDQPYDVLVRAEAAWVKKHQPKRELTANQKIRIREVGKNVKKTRVHSGEEQSKN